jgi:osmotically inducible protein OsmC
MTGPILYETAATATGDGRNGRSRSIDGALDVTLATPKELGGDGGATNPEQLFAAGYAACFHSAIKLVARREKVELVDSAIIVDVGLRKTSNGGFGLQVAIEAELPGVERAAAERMMTLAHGVCPYSNAIRGNVDVALTVA